MRESIAELVEEASESPWAPARMGLNPQERALIANVLRLREITADDVMVPRPDIVAMRADVTLAQAIDADPPGGAFAHAGVPRASR